jgi:hypothetical protein
VRVKDLYSILFTEYPGHLGFGPAVITLAVTIAVCATVLYGGVTLGKAIFFAHGPAAETGHS